MNLRDQIRLRQRRAANRHQQRQRENKDISFHRGAFLCQIRWVLAIAIRALMAKFLVAVAGKSGFHRRVSKFANFAKYWLPPLLWMGIIFSASGDTNSYRHSSTLFEPLLHWLFPHLPQAQVETLHYYFRKCAHLSEYAILALLLRRAIRQAPKQSRRPWRWDEAGLALAIVYLYAASDELHQVFVPNRCGQVSDVLVDCSGAVLGLGLLWFGGKILKRW